jgi:hypothetical protein
MAANTVTAIDFIKKSAALYADSLYHFRECHDLCVQSGLFTKPEVLEVDVCAINFRELGLESVTVAKMTSVQWLDSVIMLYKNLGTLAESDIKSMQDLLSGQARELSSIYTVIAAWSKSITGQFLKANADITKESGVFKQRFQNALDKAKKIEEAANKQAEAAAKALKEIQNHGKKLHPSRLTLPLTPFSPLTNIGKAVTDGVAEARKLDELARKRLLEAEEKLKEAEKNNQKAKVCHQY